MAVKIIPHPEQKAIPSDDMPHFVATYHRAVAMQEDPWVTEPMVTIYLGKRGSDKSYPEWLEHRILVTMPSGTVMHIGAIQRHIDAGSEFHS